MREKRCTRQFALNVEKNAKYHSSQMEADLYTAENVTRREHHQEEIVSRVNQRSLRLVFLQLLHSFFKSLK